ncbi:MAG TPA: hypothetical protein VJN93_17270 [Candidatus Acidoferrum sp.]|nr:hypothetical protein [Candidatus Acidoferrum sp.]
MNPIFQFASLAVVTVFAAAAALAFDWMLLRAMFLLMQPASARRAPRRTILAHGTVEAVQAYAQHH